MSNHATNAGPVPDWLNSQYVEKILKKLEQYQNVKVLNVVITPGSVDGDNYACQIFRLSASIINNSQESLLSIIGKYKISTKMTDSIENNLELFETEAKFFSKMPPLLQNILNKTDLEFLPKCFYVDLEQNIILMEDLKALNYTLQPRSRLLNKKQAVLVLEALASMHGASLKILLTNPEFKDKFGKSIWTGKGSDILKTFSNNTQNSLNKYMHVYNLSKNYQEKLAKTRENLETNWLQVCDLQEDHLNVLLHGDCWRSNMMFHYQNDTADKVKLLDFQIYNYNSFANDLQYFLFTSVSPEVIVDEIDSLLEIYFQKLHSIAPEIPNLTLDRIKKEFAERYYFGFVVSLMFRPFNTSDIVPDLEKMFAGNDVSTGFNSNAFIENLQMLLPFFEKVGVF